MILHLLNETTETFFFLSIRDHNILPAPLSGAGNILNQKI